MTFFRESNIILELKHVLTDRITEKELILTWCRSRSMDEKCRRIWSRLASDCLPRVKREWRVLYCWPRWRFDDGRVRSSRCQRKIWNIVWWLVEKRICRRRCCYSCHANLLLTAVHSFNNNKGEENRTIQSNLSSCVDVNQWQLSFESFNRMRQRSALTSTENEQVNEWTYLLMKG